jgi:hypothetical protein
VQPLEEGSDEAPPSEGIPVAVLALHGQLPCAVSAKAAQAPGVRVGYVQTAGGALPGSLSRDVVALREQDLICGHITAAPAYGGTAEAISVVGALDAAANGLEWDAVIAGPGPGILGSATRYGHGGMAALDTAHAALALGMPTLLSPRLSAVDPRPRQRMVSHHTQTVLELLLAGVEIPVPEGEADVAAALEPWLADRHRLRTAATDLDGYAASGLPARTMGRGLEDDPLFFAAALASGAALAAATGGGGG